MPLCSASWWQAQMRTLAVVYAVMRRVIALYASTMQGALLASERKTLANSLKTYRRATNLSTPHPRQNDPHKLRRLRRPTGPRRAALC